jgi:alpha-1,6-mannosyltransferase
VTAALPAFLAVGLLFDLAVWWQGLTQDDGAFSPETHSQPYRNALWLLVLFLPYLWLLWAHRHGGGYRRRTIWVAFAVVAVPLVFAPPVQSHDVFQYLVYGHMQVSHGLNPYLANPADLPGDPWVAWATWDHTSSVYGPVWSLLVAALVALAGPHPVGALLLVKCVTFVAVLVTGLGLSALRPSRSPLLTGDPSGHLAGFLLNPLVLTTGILGAHADVVLAAAVAVAMVLDQRGRRVAVVVVLGLAVLVKAYAVFALAAYVYVLWRRGQRRAVAGGLAAVLLLGVVASWPYWRGWATLRPLLATGGQSSASLAGLLQEALTWVLAHLGLADAAQAADVVVRLAGAAVLIGVAWWAATRRTVRSDPWWLGAVLLGTFLLVSPWFLPWYLVSLLALTLPLAHAGLRRAVVTATASSLVVLPLAGDFVQTALRYAPPLLTLRFPRRTTGVDG